METKRCGWEIHFKPKNFEELYESVWSIRKNMSQEDAVTSLIYCCHICIEKSNHTSVKCLKSVMKIAYSLISSLNEKQLIQYVQAIYHIVKYLSDQDLYITIIEIENMLWPPFLPASLSPKIQNIYLNMSKLLTNLIARCVKQDDILSDSNLLLKINEISRKICSAVTDPLAYLTQSVSSFINLSKLKISAEQYKDHFIFIFKQIQLKINNKNALDFYQPLLTLSGLVLHYILLNSTVDIMHNFFQQIKECVLKIFHNATFKNLYDLLEMPLLLLDLKEQNKVQKLSTCNDTIKVFVNSEVKQHRQELGNKLQAMMITVMNYYKSSGSSRLMNISESLQVQMLTCICSLSEIESQACIKCSCGCLVTVNSYQSFKTCQIIISFVELSFNLPQLSSSYHEKIVTMLSKFADKIIYLNKYQCKNWKIAWSTLGTSVYNLAVQLYKKKNEKALHYFYFFLKHFLVFENDNVENIIKRKVLSSSLQAVCSLNSNDYAKCMAFCALGIYLCKEQGDYFMSLWITTKHTLKGKNVEIQLVTLAQAFEKFSMELSVVIKSANFLKKEDAINLLIFELEQYKLKWKSKIPMMTVLKELVNHISNVEKIVEIIGNTFGDSDLIFHDDVLEIAGTALKQVEGKSSKYNVHSNLVLSILYFLNYKCRMKRTILRQAEEMEQTLKVIPIKKTSVNKDPNEEFDIVSTYENLKLDKYLNNIKYLNSAVELIGKYLADILNNGDKFGLYHILMHIAFEYSLIGNRFEVIKALNFAVKIAQNNNEPQNIIHSISFLIEHSDVRKDCIVQLISCADEAIKKISKSKSTIKTFLIYYICKAKAFLYEDPKESFRNYTIVQDILNNNNYGDYFDHIRNKLLYLKLKYLTIPCSILPDLHKENLVDIFVRLPVFFEELTRSTENAYEISSAMETNEAITEFYRCMKCPREVRHYCKDMALLTQKLVLPLRCCIYLIYLSQADLYSSRLDDCRVKLNGIVDILCFSRCTEEQGKDLKTIFDFELETIINNMKDIQLDVNNKAKNSSSPIFTRETCYPTLCQNKESCKSCFWCTCFEYRDLVIKKIHLEAMISVKQNDFNAAKILFNTGLNLHKYYKQNARTLDNDNYKRIYQDFIHQTTTDYLHSYGLFLLDFAKFLVNINNKASARIVNEQNRKLLEPFKYRYMYLFQDALLQKLALVTDIPELDVPVTSPVEESEDIIKTPEYNQNKVLVRVQKISPCSPIVKVPLKKRLQFEASPEADNNKTVQIKSVAIKREPSSSRKETICQKDQSVARKDRAKLPKIKIYSEVPEESTVNKGRVTRAKNTRKFNENEAKTKDVPETANEIKSVRRKYSSRKNLLGELNVKNDK